MRATEKREIKLFDRFYQMLLLKCNSLVHFEINTKQFDNFQACWQQNPTAFGLLFLFFKKKKLQKKVSSQFSKLNRKTNGKEIITCINLTMHKDLIGSSYSKLSDIRTMCFSPTPISNIQEAVNDNRNFSINSSRSAS